MKQTPAQSTGPSGKTWLIRLPDDGDLLTSIEEICRKHRIQTAVFTVWGAARNCTWGVYDPTQQVYASFHREEIFQIAHCTGNVSMENERIKAVAAGVLASIDGAVVAGRLFSETAVVGAEAAIWAPAGEAIQRHYDEFTGLYLWPSEA
jgi:uncharacterized protein